MTSKISYFKFIESNIKHRGWLAALTAAALFFMMPIHTLVTLDGIKRQEAYAPGTKMLTDWVIDSIPGFLNGSHFLILGPLIAVIGILCAVTGFAYLHSREKQDFYHGMPVTRMQWFAISYVSGILIFLLPYLLFGLCTILIAGANITITAGFLGLCAAALFRGVIGFLICYHTAVLAMFVTGRIITGVLAALVMIVYGSIIPPLFTGLGQYFFAAWSGNVPDFLLKVQEFCSPAALFFQLLTGPLTGHPLSGVMIGITAALILLAASLVLCRYYPAEAAENALAFPRTAPFIKFMIAVPTALFIGLLIKFFNSSVNVNWVVIFSIISVILVCMVIEFIYHQDLSKLLAGKISTALSLGVVLVIVCILKFDILGYDTYLPKEANLKSISMSVDLLSGYFTYPEYSRPTVYHQLDEEDFAVTDYAPLYKLAEEGIQNLKQGITPEQVTMNDSGYGFINVTLRYQLHSGKNVYREYAVSRDEALQALTSLCKDEDYRKMMFPIFHFNKDEVMQIGMKDIYFEPVTLTLDRSQQNELLSAYEKDVMAASLPDMQYESPLGELILFTEDSSIVQTGNSSRPNLIQTGQFYIYRSYKNTLTLLEDYGYTLREEIDPKDVMFMTYYPTENSESDNYARKEIIDYDFGEGISITKPEEIKELLGRISYDECNGILGGRIKAVGSVEITLREKSYPNSYAVSE